MATRTSNQPIHHVHDYRVNEKSFTIFVGGDPAATASDDEPGVTYHMADRFERNLGLLSTIDPKRPITVLLSSNGGYWEEGMQMFGALLVTPNPVTVIGTKDCRSMTSIIPLAADKFLLRPPAMYMIHRGSWGGEDREEAIDTMDIERRKTHEIMNRIYAARLKEKTPKVSEARIKDRLNELFRQRLDVWYSSAEAVGEGFVDGLFDGSKGWQATGVNTARRARMMAAISRPVKVEITVT